MALDLKVGDELRIAGQTFTVRGVIARDRVQRSGIAFGPRVYVDLADLRATSLLGFGSRATYQLLVRVQAPSPQAVTAGLRATLRREVASVRSWQTLEDRIGENLSVAENYLSLVGFAIVARRDGVWSVTRVIVSRDPSVTILKCISATSGACSIYVLESCRWPWEDSSGWSPWCARADSPSCQPLGVAAVRRKSAAVQAGRRSRCRCCLRWYRFWNPAGQTLPC
jgi:predicted lysophospholipase L1 biosynthesis ABC-type transport system permease subunit